MTNKTIRDAIRIANLKQWQIADALGVHEATFCVWLRHELPAEKQKQILAVIEELKKKEAWLVNWIEPLKQTMPCVQNGAPLQAMTTV